MEKIDEMNDQVVLSTDHCQHNWQVAYWIKVPANDVGNDFAYEEADTFFCTKCLVHVNKKGKIQ